jgi:hypothetical protein
MPNRASPIGSDRERAYGVLEHLKRDGWIDRYIAAQHPGSGRWGFWVAPTPGTPDDERLYLLPREVHAFAQGIIVATERARKAFVAREFVEIASRARDTAKPAET